MTRLDDLEPNVPETLQQLIEVQFEQLDGVEQAILRSASVAGDRFSVWAITTAAELEAASIEDACERLAERELFIRAAGIHELASGEFSAHYEFKHSLYREVLYRRLSDVSRSKQHQLLGQRLEALCIPCEQELATELALHFEEGHEYEQAIRYLILGAENAVGRFAYRDSIEILQHALELVAKLSPALRAELEVQTLEFIGDAHFALGALPSRPKPTSRRQHRRSERSQSRPGACFDLRHVSARFHQSRQGSCRDEPGGRDEQEHGRPVALGACANVGC